MCQFCQFCQNARMPNAHKRHPLLNPTTPKQETLTARKSISRVAVRVSTKEFRGSVVGDFCERLGFSENAHPANENGNNLVLINYNNSVTP